MNVNAINPAMLLGLLGITFMVATIATRIAITLSHRLEIMDQPAGRKSHREPVAYLGGLGMYVAFMLGLAACALIRPDLAVLHGDTFGDLMFGATVIYLIGFYDDIRPMRAILKLAFQVAIASWMWWVGVRIELLSFFPEGSRELGTVVSYIATVGWYVALMNSINLVDGLDGLAGGITLIGALALVGVSLVIAPAWEVLLGAMVATVIAGSVLGFLVYNWHPAKIFMGDGGSLLLGYLLASVSLLGSTKTPTLIALAVPLVALGLPLFETSFSFLRRLLKGQHPFKPDRRHLHHRLLDLGLDQQRVVIILHFITAFLGINSIILAQAESRILMMNIVFLLGGMIILIENLKFLEKKRSA